MKRNMMEVRRANSDELDKMEKKADKKLEKLEMQEMKDAKKAEKKKAKQLAKEFKKQRKLEKKEAEQEKFINLMKIAIVGGVHDILHDERNEQPNAFSIDSRIIQYVIPAIQESIDTMKRDIFDEMNRRSDLLVTRAFCRMVESECYGDKTNNMGWAPKAYGKSWMPVETLRYSEMADIGYGYFMFDNQIFMIIRGSAVCLDDPKMTFVKYVKTNKLISGNAISAIKELEVERLELCTYDEPELEEIHNIVKESEKRIVDRDLNETLAASDETEETTTETFSNTTPSDMEQPFRTTLSDPESENEEVTE